MAEYKQGRAPVGSLLFDWLQVALALSYLASCFFELRRYRDKMQGYYSDLSELDLRWLWRMVVAHTTVWSLVAVRRIVEAVVGHVFQGWGLLIQLGSAALIFLTGYIALNQREVGPKARAAEVPAAESEPAAPSGLETSRARPKYQRNRLAEDDANELAQRLTACMVERELFRDSNLTLQALADELAITPHALSQVLNARLGMNFYTFVNGFRTEALKNDLTNPLNAEKGVLELGFQVGFHSKSTLNQFFKKATGVTPSEFRRQATRSAQRSAAAS